MDADVAILPPLVHIEAFLHLMGSHGAKEIMNHMEVSITGGTPIAGWLDWKIRTTNG